MERKNLLKVVKDPLPLDSDDSILLRNDFSGEEPHDSIRKKIQKKEIVERQKKTFNPKEYEQQFDDQKIEDLEYKDLQFDDRKVENKKYQNYFSTDPMHRNSSTSQKIFTNPKLSHPEPNAPTNMDDNDSRIEDLVYDSLTFDLDENFDKSVYVDGARVGKIRQFVNGLMGKIRDKVYTKDENKVKEQNDENLKGKFYDGTEPVATHKEEETTNSAEISPQNYFSPQKTKDASERHKKNSKNKKRRSDLQSNNNRQTLDSNLPDLQTTKDLLKAILSSKFATIIAITVFSILFLSISSNFKLYFSNNLLRIQFDNLQSISPKSVPKITDLARINTCSIISHPSPFYYNLFFKRTGNSIHSILIENFDLPFVFSDLPGKFIFEFNEKVKITGIGFLHPKNETSLKLFKIKDEIFEYDTPGKYKYFDINEFTGKNIEISVESNYGKNGKGKITSIYKIYIFGYVLEDDLDEEFEEEL